MFENMVFETIKSSKRKRNSKPMVTLFNNGSVRLNAQAFELAKSIQADADSITVMLSKCHTAIAIKPISKGGLKPQKYLGCQSISLCKIIGVDKKISLEIVEYNGLLCAEIKDEHSEI